ncbi:YraN family protein [Jannaschia sp. R86511]|uniref:YraN family protein n=1 Tax=Jannaschia sp. R86511 TaxID=3093853 RepID=UPI0036D29B59
MATAGSRATAGSAAAGSTAAVGVFGEQLVHDRLVGAGWRVLERNWRSGDRDCPGELDLVAVDPDGVLVVVEVRTRRGDSCGTALESVTPIKLRRLRRLFGVWWSSQDPRARVRYAGGARVDVVAVQLRRSGPCDVTHVRGVG